MKDRIKQIRAVAGLTQQEFADKLKIKRNTIAKYETGRGEPIDAVVSLICREFGISEIWLRTGSGEMFMPVSRDEKIAAFLGGVMREESGFKKRFIRMLSKLDEKDWTLLEKMAQTMAAEEK